MTSQLRRWALAAGLAGQAHAAPTPELQNALKERNLKAPGRLTGQAPAPQRGLGKVPAKGPDGQETPQRSGSGIACTGARRPARPAAT